jgi:hypothetical protein
MRTVTILALNACAMAFQVGRTSAGRPPKIYYTTTPPRMFSFPKGDELTEIVRIREVSPGKGLGRALNGGTDLFMHSSLS